MPLGGAEDSGDCIRCTASPSYVGSSSDVADCALPLGLRKLEAGENSFRSTRPKVFVVTSASGFLHHRGAPMKVRCPTCRVVSQCKTDCAGKVVRCNKCGEKFRVPLPKILSSTDVSDRQAVVFEPPSPRPSTAPVSYPSPQPAFRTPAVQTIEKTSKTWKAIMLIGLGQILLSFGLIVFGMVASVAIGPLSGLPVFLVGLSCVLLFVGLATFVVGVLCGWWFHG